MKSYNTGRYTPDSGECEEATCDICQTKMDVERNQVGARTFAGAMGGHKEVYDRFLCPNIEADWHKQIVALRKFIDDIPSQSLSDIIEEEIKSILKKKKVTKEGYGFGWGH